jgi:Ca-activated chloride channel homolog
MPWFIVAVLLCSSIYISSIIARRTNEVILVPFFSQITTHRLSSAYKILLHLLSALTVFFFTLLLLYSLVGGGPFQSYLNKFFATIPTNTPVKKIFFVVDRSGSMAEKLSDDTNQPKIDVVKESIASSVLQTQNPSAIHDLLGLAAFARTEQILVPLTNDREFFLEVLNSISPEIIEALNGTALGYALFKTSILIIACSEIASKQTDLKGYTTFDSSIILITDGLEEPHPADFTDPYRSMQSLQALKICKDNHVQVHFINIDKTAFQRMSIDDRDALIEAVEATGGSYHEVLSKNQLQEVLNGLISQKELCEIPLDNTLNTNITFVLLCLTLLPLFILRIIETMILRIAR